MAKPIFLSICIPAFGRLEYITKTLESIYRDAHHQNISFDDFEVVVSDNDPNKGLQSLKEMFSYKNFMYFNTSCEGFMNSFYALSYGKGDFLKLHNSQEIFKTGSIKILIDIVKQHQVDKELLFFSGGLLKKGDRIILDSFDQFIQKTSYLSSWSNAFGIWKEDFEKVKDQIQSNKMFPHTTLLFSQIKKTAYVVIDAPLFVTQFVRKRGGHNKFQAFTIEYPSILDVAVKQGDISDDTRNKVIKQLINEFLPSLYFNVKIARRETYEYAGFKENLKIYFPKNAYYKIVLLSLIAPLKILWRKITIKLINR
ncbi:glycosyltransferase family 2 protein [Sphingobacterium multivorum]|uniref:glycosyltransferase family 2 protein n=1 Tax=Sphingobacterium multivorum TaxID=28454 RepID=UPI003DA3FDED